MITLNDVQKVTIGPDCQGWFCQHDSTITLKDGRSASCGNSLQIWSIISKLPLEMINPEKGWVAADVKAHFKKYDGVMGWKSTDVVLNEIFGTTFAPKRPSFDMDKMLLLAQQFSGENHILYCYIFNILMDISFQNDPKAYLAEWTKRRGRSEVYRMPEDRARSFFNQNFKGL